MITLASFQFFSENETVSSAQSKAGVEVYSINTYLAAATCLLSLRVLNMPN